MMDPIEYRRFQRVRWTIYLILVLSYMMVYFHRMAPGVLASDLMQAFSTSGAALGSLAAMYYYVYTAMQIPAGVLADNLGPRASVTAGSLVAGAGSILFGLAPEFNTAALGRLLVGLGVSVVFVGLMKANTLWFSERRYGLVSGLTLLLGNLGSILAAGPLALLLLWLSWRNVFIFAGGLSLLLAVITWLWVRNRPEEAGFSALSDTPGKSQPVAREHWLLGLQAVMGNPAVWPGFWVNFGITGTLFAFAGLWGVPLLQDLFALSRSEASLYTTAALAGFAVGCLAMGALSDALRRRKPVILLAGLLSAACWLAMIGLDWRPGWSGLLLYAVLGLSAGGFVVSYGAAKEVVLPHRAGMAIAVVNTGLFLGAALMQPLFGWAMDLAWDGTLIDGVRQYGRESYHNGLWLSFGFTLIALLGGWRLRETGCRNRAVSPHGR